MFRILIFLLSLLVITPPLKGSDIPELEKFLSQESIALRDFPDVFPFLDEISQRTLLLMGEASHGTSEYYTWRAAISQYMIEKHGFRFIAVEGDWPSAYEVNRFVKHLPGAANSAEEALKAFERWPHWMWQNEETLALVSWLRAYNAGLPPEKRVGFYGVDMQNKALSMAVVLDKLARKDAALYQNVRRNYQCFTRFPDQRAYLQAVMTHNSDCSSDLRQARDMISNLTPDERWDEEALFNLRFNAELIVTAEENLRGNLSQGPASWNIRARHFQTTASHLLQRYGDGAQGLVWAHNTHIGDARATGMGQAGMVNIGQLAREQLGDEHVFLLGIGGFKGSLLAGRSWGAAMESMPLVEAMPGSWEYILHHSVMGDSFVPLYRGRSELGNVVLGNRAIGVTFQPENERQQNYVPSQIFLRYDGFLFLENTRSLSPLSQ